jgi:hypothetical protein
MRALVEEALLASMSAEFEAVYARTQRPPFGAARRPM